jgi:site-specific DNA-methyltransferase (adenine-specific)
MPAHYALLHFVKAGGPVMENSTLRAGSPQFCVRATCVHQRKAEQIEDTEPLGDIWSDIFRLKHKSARDSHPCQLPEKLMERIITLSTKPGDVVLDAFCGAGTTAVTAAKIGRRYITIDINPDYVSVTRQKLKTISAGGEIRRHIVARPKPIYSKKELQLDLQRIALNLGRLPKEREIEKLSNYPLAAYKAMFPTLGKALKAAKLVT